MTKITANNIQLDTLTAVTTPKIAAIGYGGDDLATAVGGGQTVTLSGSGFISGCQILIGTVYASVVTFVSSTVVTFVAPAKTAGTYTLYVVNPDGGTGISIPGVSYSDAPVFGTVAGSLGTEFETNAFLTTIGATSDTVVTYSVYSGTLPVGLSLNSETGVISGNIGTVANPTTYTFTVRATDLELQDVDRNFSITVDPDVVTFNTPASTATYANVTGDVFSLTLNATSIMGKTISYSANVLPNGLTLSNSAISGTFTLDQTVTTLLTATAATTNKTANRILNWLVNPITAPGPTAMWIQGGEFGSILSSVSRISFATDTSVSSARGPLSLQRKRPGSAGNDNYGWLGGGEQFSNGPSSRVDRITYATDTETASVRGPLSLSLRHLGGTGNSNFGWYGAGFTPGGATSSLTRVTYTTDTATSTTRGSLIAARYYYHTGTDRSTYGYWSDGAQTSYIQRLTFSNDTATASNVGSFAVGRSYDSSFAGTTTFGWFAGGTDNTGNTGSAIHRLTFSNSTSVIRNYLVVPRVGLAGGNNDVYGYYAAGLNVNNNTHYTTVERLEFSSDTNATATRGPVNTQRFGARSTSGYQ